MTNRMAARRRAPRRITELGQVFTPAAVVRRMLRLRQNFGDILEPAAGNGAFLAQLERSAQGIELDETLCQDPRLRHGDFFAFATERRFDTIIGNPPYVRFRDIPPATRRLLPMRLFDARSNLYLFFIAKCVDHLNDGGELIFITPRDFIKATAARKLNQKLYDEGSFTDFHDLGDCQIFPDHTPNCAIWRWQKGRRERRLADGRAFRFRDGQIWFGEEAAARLGDYFAVKVGAVSGADAIFASEERGCTDFICSQTAASGRTRRMIYQRLDRHLLPYKDKLLRRRIRRFDETNWWQWGRGYHEFQGPRIYVNCKTRRPRPFFLSEIEAYDGSVLALFPRQELDLEQAAARLNDADWRRLGFVCGGRYLFSQRSLENAALAL